MKGILLLAIGLCAAGCSPRLVDVRPYAGRPEQQVDLDGRLVAWEHQVRTTVRYMGESALNSAFRLPGPADKTANPFMYSPPRAHKRFIVFHLTIRNESEYDVFVDAEKIYLRDESGAIFRPVTKEDLINYWIGRVTIELGKPVTWSNQMDAAKKRTEDRKSIAETVYGGGRIPPYGEHSGYVAFTDDIGTLKRASVPDPPDLLGYASIGGLGFTWGGSVGAGVGAVIGGSRDYKKGGQIGGGIGGMVGGALAGMSGAGSKIGGLGGGLAGYMAGAAAGKSMARTAGEDAGGIVGGAVGGAVGGFVGGTVGAIWKSLSKPPKEERTLQLYVEIVTRASRYGNPLRMSLLEFNFDKVLVPARPAGDEEFDPWRQ